ncbi:hypothetical protein QBC35DRAFT_475715 [Podospora australis]|uniref:Uncharacterized protein n=1 Tax=Podospora australis TaxID=1536484 RepID=A0AAN6WQH6_9PEZI|nr:hypothetical protein QBC35DRAFT_475715 [Podospora australis]
MPCNYLCKQRPKAPTATQASPVPCGDGSSPDEGRDEEEVYSFGVGGEVEKKGGGGDEELDGGGEEKVKGVDAQVKAETEGGGGGGDEEVDGGGEGGRLRLGGRDGGFWVAFFFLFLTASGGY